MAKQEIKVGGAGADSRRVLEVLTPVTGGVAPAVNAEYIGQIYVDSVTPAVYVAVKVGDEVPANDWKEISFEVSAG